MDEGEVPTNKLLGLREASKRRSKTWQVAILAQRVAKGSFCWTHTMIQLNIIGSRIPHSIAFYWKGLSTHRLTWNCSEIIDARIHISKMQYLQRWTLLFVSLNIIKRRKTSHIWCTQSAIDSKDSRARTTAYIGEFLSRKRLFSAPVNENEILGVVARDFMLTPVNNGLIIECYKLLWTKESFRMTEILRKPHRWL